jgi:hypothetical protein
MYNVILRRVRETVLAAEKQQVLHISVYVHTRACVRVWGGGCPGMWACACVWACVDLLIQHAKCMHHIVLSFVAPSSTTFYNSIS